MANTTDAIATLSQAGTPVPETETVALGCAEGLKAARALSVTGCFAKSGQGLMPGTLPLPGVFAHALARALHVPDYSCSCAAGRTSPALLIRSFQARVGRSAVRAD